MASHSHDPHEHEGHRGLKSAALAIFAPHSHDAADSIDTALESSERGIRAVKISFSVLLLTSAFQLGVIVASGSVALLADTIHNFSDALTAVPLFIAFRLARRSPTRRYTYGYGRAEDIAGLFVIAMITLSAVIAAYEAIRRLITPQGIDHIGWVAAAGIIGFVGNELVALYRIREGRRSDPPRSPPTATTPGRTASRHSRSFSVPSGSGLDSMPPTPSPGSSSRSRSLQCSARPRRTCCAG